MSSCRSCKQPVDWAQFQSGKKAPFDLDEQVAEAGDSRWVLEPAVDEAGKSILLARRADNGERGVMCHFATCPDSDNWRKED